MQSQYGRCRVKRFSIRPQRLTRSLRLNLSCGSTRQGACTCTISSWARFLVPKPTQGERNEACRGNTFGDYRFGDFAICMVGGPERSVFGSQGRHGERQQDEARLATANQRFASQLERCARLLPSTGAGRVYIRMALAHKAGAGDVGGPSSFISRADHRFDSIPFRPARRLLDFDAFCRNCRARMVRRFLFGRIDHRSCDRHKPGSVRALRTGIDVSMLASATSSGNCANEVCCDARATTISASGATVTRPAESVTATTRKPGSTRTASVRSRGPPAMECATLQTTAAYSCTGTSYLARARQRPRRYRRLA
jgi:hypothetical protein